MTRLAATLKSPVSLWANVASPFRGLASLVAAVSDDVSGLESLDRQQDHVRRLSRHWLM